MDQVDGFRYPFCVTLCILQYLPISDGRRVSISPLGERLVDYCYSESDKNEEAQAQLLGCPCDSGWHTLERFA